MKRIPVILFALLISISIAHAGYKPKARWIATDISLWGVNISTSADTVQKALDEVNEMTISTATYAVTAGTATYPSALLHLSDTPSSFDTGKFLKAWTSSSTWAACSGGSSTFIGLTDTPAGFDSGKYFRSWTSSGTWEALSGDNLGNHTATQDIDASAYSLSITTITATGTGTFGDLIVDTNVLVVDAANDKVGIGTIAPDSIFHIKANVLGTVGSHPAGQLIIQDPDDTVFGNAVITGYESDGAGNPDQQLWYLGSSSSSNADIIFLNRRNAKLHLGTNDVSRLTILGNGNVGIGTNTPGSKLEVNGTITSGDIDASGYKVTSSSLTVTNNATVGSLSSSGQVTSNGNKLIDVYDWAVVITTPTWLGTDAVLVSPIRSFAVTITTITMITTGGTNFVGMIEQRAYASPHSAGTDIWSGDVTVSSTTWTTGTPDDYTVPADYGLYLKPTSVSGPVKILTLRGIVSKD